MTESPPPPPASSEPDRPVPASPAGPGGLRASDTDRERYVAVLREAYAEGRLQREEYEERMDAAYRARTYDDLSGLVTDLPVGHGTLPAVPRHAGPPVPSHASAPHGTVQPGGAWGIEVAPAGTAAPAAGPAIAVFGGEERKGRWVVPGELTAFAMFGGVELDLSSAVLERNEVTITATAIFGGVEIVVPHGVEVRLEGFAVFGGRSAPSDTVVPPAGGPVVRVVGVAIFGGIDIKRPKTPALPPGPSA